MFNPSLTPGKPLENAGPEPGAGNPRGQEENIPCQHSQPVQELLHLGEGQGKHSWILYCLFQQEKQLAENPGIMFNPVQALQSFESEVSMDFYLCSIQNHGTDTGNSSHT